MSSNNVMKSSLSSTSFSDVKKKIPSVPESVIPNTVSHAQSKPTHVVNEPKKTVVVPATKPAHNPVVMDEIKKETIANPTPLHSKQQPVTVTNVKAKLLVKKLDPGAVLPERKTDGAAGYDICCLEKRVILPPNSHKLVSTGLSFTVPEGTYGQLVSRSGLSVKGVSVGAGVIDRDYTGEIKVMLFNHSSEKVYLNEKDRIAQLIIKKIDLPVVEEVDSLETTVRGMNGFGSTDKK